jgi:hypothetical protein
MICNNLIFCKIELTGTSNKLTIFDKIGDFTETLLFALKSEKA